MSEHTIRRDQLPRLRRILEHIPFQGHDHPDDRDRVIVEVAPEYDHLVTKCKMSRQNSPINTISIT